MTIQASLGLAAIAAVLVGAAIMGDQAVSRQGIPGKVTVTYWEKWTGAEADEMKKTVDAFNASQDRIFVQYLSISGVDSKTMLAAAGGNPPDVAGIWLDQVAQFADANALTDLTDMAKESGLKTSDYIPAFIDGLIYHGKLWALPSTPATICLHVRSDLVPPQYATPATFPKTIEDFTDLCFSLTKRRPDGSLESTGFLPSSPGWYHWSWGPLFGAKLLDAQGNPVVNSPETIRAFEWLASFSKKFGSREVTTFQGGLGNFASPEDPFMMGKTVTEVNGPWKAGYINNFKKGLPWFAVPFPYPKDRPDLANQSFVNEDILAIPNGAKHPKEAFEFLRFVQRQDQMERLNDAHGKNTPLLKVSPAFFKNHPNPYIDVFDRLARSPSCIATPQTGIWSQVRNEINVAFEQVNTGQKAPKEALDDAQGRIDKIWATYKSQVLGGQ